MKYRDEAERLYEKVTLLYLDAVADYAEYLHKKGVNSIDLGTFRLEIGSEYPYVTAVQMPVFRPDGKAVWNHYSLAEMKTDELSDLTNILGKKLDKEMLENLNKINPKRHGIQR